jgi:hypothetical protein
MITVFGHPTCFYRTTQVGVITIEQDLDRASEWMFAIDGVMVGHGYHSAEHLAFLLSDHETGEQEWDKHYRSVHVPAEISRWIKGRPEEQRSC